MKKIFDKIEKTVSIDAYKEKNKLCGYELNTYTNGGVNQIVFVDFRGTGKDPKNKDDFKELFLERVESINIDEEIDLNREMKNYKQAFTLTQSLKDFKDWKKDLLKLAKSL